MKLPLSWIADYVEIKEKPEKLAEDLLYTGTKVEGIEKSGDDFIFDFEITPNRADCLSVIGIAREIAAIYSRNLKLPNVFSDIHEEIANKKVVKMRVLEEKLCPSYSLGTIESVKLNPSPSWLSSRLEKSGIRSLNNVVDITNYVMLETGQPMHAFDYNKIKGEMLVRSSRNNEILTTLDGIERKLPAGSIIIEDSEKIIDLAGLMGGANSEVDQNTQIIILQVPIYDPLTIRRTSQVLGLRTEASNRFEKDLDRAAHRFAFERAVELLSNFAQGQLSSNILSIGYPPSERKIKAPVSLFKKTLGIPLTTNKICDYLSRLCFSTSYNKGFLTASIPSFRTDITRPIDLTEEVGRIFGYNKFSKTLPSGQPPTGNILMKDFEMRLKQIFANFGLKEIYTNTLTSALVLENLGIKSEDCLKVSNRLIIDHEYLRPTLFVGLLETANLNIANFDTFSFFEAGRVFEKKENGKGLSAQPKKIAALLVNSNFAYAKGILEAVLKKLNLYDKAIFSKNNPYLPFAKDAANIFIGEKLFGTIGNIETSVLSKFDLSAPTFGFELDLAVLEESANETFYQPVPKFPIVRENISLFLPDKLEFSKVLNALKKGAGKHYFQSELLEDVRIKNKRSVLIGIEYISLEHTLRRGEVGKIREKVFDELKAVEAEPRTKQP